VLVVRDAVLGVNYGLNEVRLFPARVAEPVFRAYEG
jgi:hypothetical protein